MSAVEAQVGAKRWLMACMKALKILSMAIVFCKLVQPYVRNASQKTCFPKESTGR